MANKKQLDKPDRRALTPPTHGTVERLETAEGLTEGTDRLLGLAMQDHNGEIVILPLSLDRRKDYQIHYVSDNGEWILKQRTRRKAHTA